ncbi:hypothetical protein J7412_08475 [Shimia sp. R9_3]|nr:hypothetical protein [Shimia sp. R9_3]
MKNHDTVWGDFGDAGGILATYVLQFQDDETGVIHEETLSAADITP